MNASSTIVKPLVEAIDAAAQEKVQAAPPKSFDFILLARPAKPVGKDLAFIDGVWTRQAGDLRHTHVAIERVEIEGSHDILPAIVRAGNKRGTYIMVAAVAKGQNHKNVSRGGASFVNFAHSYFPLDFDGFDCDSDDILDLARAARAICPVECRASPCAVNVTASHRYKNGLAHVRLWFALARPMTVKQIDSWLGGVEELHPSIDKTLYQPERVWLTQVRKIIGDGGNDPVPTRWAILPGECAVNPRVDMTMQTRAPGAVSTATRVKGRVAHPDARADDPDFLAAALATEFQGRGTTLSERGRHVAIRLTLQRINEFAFSPGIARLAIGVWLNHKDDAAFDALVGVLAKAGCKGALSVSDAVRASGERVAPALEARARKHGEVKPSDIDAIVEEIYRRPDNAFGATSFAEWTAAHVERTASDSGDVFDAVASEPVGVNPYAEYLDRVPQRMKERPDIATIMGAVASLKAEDLRAAAAAAAEAAAAPDLLQQALNAGDPAALIAAAPHMAGGIREVFEDVQAAEFFGEERPGTMALLRAVAAFEVAPPPPPAAPAEPADALPLVSLAAHRLRDRARPEWLVRNLIPQVGFGNMIGRSQSFKSFVLLYLMMCCGQGRRFFGAKIVERTCSVYIYGEGDFGVENRLAALERAYPGAADTIVLVNRRVDLFGARKAAEKTMLGAITEAEKLTGLRCGLLALDTMAALAPGMDESGAKDVGLVQDMMRRVAKTAKLAVIGLHHLGKDETRGARGSSAWIGNVDFSIAVVREGDAMHGTVTTEGASGKAKDSEKLAPSPFTMRRHVLDHYDDGEEISSLSVAEMDKALDTTGGAVDEAGGLDAPSAVQHEYLSALLKRAKALKREKLSEAEILAGINAARASSNKPLLMSKNVNQLTKALEKKGWVERDGESGAVWITAPDTSLATLSEGFEGGEL